MLYEQSEEWQDVVPIPQDEGGPNPLAAIAYTEEYTEAMSYLRAIMLENESSERALRLTAHIIDMNPAHYTVWLYRASIVKTLKKDPVEEIEWLNCIALQRSKNYQIWQHRQTIVDHLGKLPNDELKFLAEVLEKDAKNYHVWSYRQWIVKRFGLWPPTQSSDAGATPSPEIVFVETLLHEDVYNNSAWNHRFFVLFGREGATGQLNATEGSIAETIWDREIQFAKAKITLAPQNISAWNYLQGVQRQRGRPLAELVEFAQEFADPARPHEVLSSHALDLLAEVWATTDTSSAEKALKLLAERFDPIRANYWQWRISLLPSH